MTVVLAVVAVVQVGAGRAQHAGGDRPAAELRHDLIGVLPGAAGIRVASDLHAALADLREWSGKLGGRRFAIVPDVPAWWILSRSPNPLPIDGPQDPEKSRSALIARVSQAVDAQHGQIVILVFKPDVPGFGRPSTTVLAPVRDRWRQVGESEYLNAYE